MASPEVRDANKAKREAKKDAKVASIDAQTDEIRSTFEEEEEAVQEITQAVQSAADQITVSAGANNSLEIRDPATGIVYEVVSTKSMDALRAELGQLLGKMGQGFKQFGRSSKKRFQKVESRVGQLGELVTEQADILEARQDSLAGAQASTHHELEGAGNDLTRLLGFWGDYVGPALKIINSGDYTPHASTLAVVEGLTTLAGNMDSPWGKQLVEAVSAGIQMWAYYNPNVGIASIFMPGDVRANWPDALTAADTINGPTAGATATAVIETDAGPVLAAIYG